MASLIKCSIFFLLAVASECFEHKFYRFDYEWSKPAGGWLKYNAVPASWDQARQRCQAEGSVLASPLTNQLKAAIISLVQNRTGSDFSEGFSIFTGVHALFSDGDYSSIEGTPMLRLALRWAAGEPDNRDNSERCLAMLVGGGAMADTRCDRVLPYVCYKQHATLSMTECGTVDPEYVLERGTGSCYKFHEKGLPWKEAYMTCVAEGGYLAIINDEKEANVITEIFARHPKEHISAASHNSVFIGFHSWGHHSYRTIHGESLEANYHVWAGGSDKLMNSTRKKPEELRYCGSVTKAVKLFNSNCNSPLAFLCEKHPYSLLGPVLFN